MARAAEANGVWRERGSLWSVMGTRGEGGGRLSRARQWRSADCGGELLEIMREADEVPLVLHLVEAAEQELSEAARLLDLAEDRLDGDLAQAIAAATPGTLEPGGHRRDPAARPRRARLGGRGFAVALPPGGDVGARAARVGGGQIGLRAVAGIGRGLARDAAGVGDDRVDHRRQLVLVAARVSDAGGDDDLMPGIDRGLRVVALDEAVLGLEDAALGVGEVALRLVFRDARRGRLLAFAARRATLAIVLAARRRFERRLGRADLRQPLLLVGDP